jgi:hypothetical protein
VTAVSANLDFGLGSVALSRTSGTPQNGTWQATIGPFAGIPAGFDANVTATLTARDAAGNTRNSAISFSLLGTNCGLI